MTPPMMNLVIQKTVNPNPCASSNASRFPPYSDVIIPFDGNALHFSFFNMWENIMWAFAVLPAAVNSNIVCTGSDGAFSNVPSSDDIRKIVRFVISGNLFHAGFLPQSSLSFTSRWFVRLLLISSRVCLNSGSDTSYPSAPELLSSPDGTWVERRFSNVNFFAQSIARLSCDFADRNGVMVLLSTCAAHSQ